MTHTPRKSKICHCCKRLLPLSAYRPRTPESLSSTCKTCELLQDPHKKRCSSCFCRLPRSDFSPHPTTFDRLSTFCKKCACRRAKLLYGSEAANAKDVGEWYTKGTAKFARRPRNKDVAKLYYNIRKGEKTMWNQHLTHRERYPDRVTSSLTKASEVLARREARETTTYGRPLTPDERLTMLEWSRLFKKGVGHYPSAPQRRRQFRILTGAPVSRLSPNELTVLKRYDLEPLDYGRHLTDAERTAMDAFIKECKAFLGRYPGRAQRRTILSGIKTGEIPTKPLEVPEKPLDNTPEIPYNDTTEWKIPLPSENPDNW